MIRFRLRAEERAFAIVLVVAIVTSLTSFAAWVTHVVVCLRFGDWGFLIAGAVAFPVGVVHGVGVWLGCWS